MIGPCAQCSRETWLWSADDPRCVYCHDGVPRPRPPQPQRRTPFATGHEPDVMEGQHRHYEREILASLSSVRRPA